MKSPKTLQLTPLDGYILGETYIPKGPFESDKEIEGEDKFSTVLEVSKEVMDMNGFIRKCPVKKGQIISHADTNKTFTLQFKKYRWVHFSEIHGIYE